MVAGLWAFPRFRHHIVPAGSAILVAILYWLPLTTSLEVSIAANRLSMVRHSPVALEAQLYLRRLYISCPEAKLSHRSVMVRRDLQTRGTPLRTENFVLTQREGGQWIIIVERPELSALTLAYILPNSMPQPWDFWIHSRPDKQSIFPPLTGLHVIELGNISSYRVEATNSEIIAGRERFTVGVTPIGFHIAADLGTAGAIEFPASGCDGGYAEMEVNPQDKGRSENKFAFRGDAYRFTNVKASDIKEARRLTYGKVGQIVEDELFDSETVQELKSKELVLSQDGIRAVLLVKGSRSAFSFLFATQTIWGVLLALAVFWGGLVAANGLVLHNSHGNSPGSRQSPGSNEDTHEEVDV